MAAGDIAASTPVLVTGISEIEAALDALNLAATTDNVHIIPIPLSNNQFYVFKTERTA